MPPEDAMSCEIPFFTLSSLRLRALTTSVGHRAVPYKTRHGSEGRAADDVHNDDYLRLSLPAVVMVMCDIAVFGLAPCQWRSPALICTTSPAVTSRSSCSVATTPVPAVMTRI